MNGNKSSLAEKYKQKTLSSIETLETAWHLAPNRNCTIDFENIGLEEIIELKEKCVSQRWWRMPVIPELREAEPGGLQV